LAVHPATCLETAQFVHSVRLFVTHGPMLGPIVTANRVEASEFDARASRRRRPEGPFGPPPAFVLHGSRFAPQLLAKFTTAWLTRGCQSTGAAWSFGNFFLGQNTPKRKDGYADMDRGFGAPSSGGRWFPPILPHAFPERHGPKRQQWIAKGQGCGLLCPALGTGRFTGPRWIVLLFNGPVPLRGSLASALRAIGPHRTPTFRSLFPVGFMSSATKGPPRLIASTRASPPLALPRHVWAPTVYCNGLLTGCRSTAAPPAPGVARNARSVTHY